jgi:hypothetical protein
MDVQFTGFTNMKLVTEGFIYRFTFKYAMAKRDSETEIQIWKWIAIVFILLFILMIAAGAIEAYRFRTDMRCHTIPPNAFQEARNHVMMDLSNHSENITDYRQVFGTMRKIYEGNTTQEIIQITLYGNSTVHNYIIDANTGQIVMHTQTQYGGWMMNMSNSNMMPPPGEPMNQGMAPNNAFMNQGGC